MVTIERISKTTSRFSSPDKKEMHICRKILSYWIEGAQYTASYRDKIWDGYHKFYSKENTFGFGLTKTLVEGLKENGISGVVKSSKRFKNKVKINEQDIDNRLRPHQRNSVINFFQNDYGIIVQPTRSGKTFTSAECVRLAIQNGVGTVLFFVDGTDLFKQTVEEYCNFLGLKQTDIGRIQGITWSDFKQINIATIQTVRSKLFPKKPKNRAEREKFRREKAVMKEFLESVNFLIIDEIQEFSSEKIREIIKLTDERDFFLGLSATPYKSEKGLENLFIKEYSGDIIYEVKESELIEGGFLVKSNVLWVYFNRFEGCVEHSSYGDVLSNMITNNTERNMLIKIMVEVLDELNLKTLILFSRKEHGYKISKMTGKKFLSGDDGVDTRTKSRKEFLLDEEGGVMLASKIFNKGISLNNCLILINVNGGLEQSDITQKRGRVLAQVGDKDRALLIDIFDDFEYLDEHSYSRHLQYEKLYSEDEIKHITFQQEDFRKEFTNFIKNYFEKG